ncbi:MAG: hypothetical protein EOP86_14325 [Verrucomicrobiaceae bacterium]|nr:MAG: hypothetical protein EOP86_14325 [Verrucomicrobiaceae bacterium]
MKITLDIPNDTFREVKARAALRRISLQQFIIEALEEKIRPPASPHTKPAEPPWMRGFGALAHIRDETRHVESWIAEACESPEEENRV